MQHLKDKITAAKKIQSAARSRIKFIEKNSFYGLCKRYLKDLISQKYLQNGSIDQKFFLSINVLNKVITQSMTKKWLQDNKKILRNPITLRNYCFATIYKVIGSINDDPKSITEACKQAGEINNRKLKIN